MKKPIFFIFALTLIATSNLVSAQNISIPDSVFKVRLIEAGVDKNGDKEIQINEALQVTKLSFHGVGSYFSSIFNTEGLQYFTNLKDLKIAFHRISSIDLSQLTQLETLDLSANRLTSLNVDALKNLVSLSCKSNQQLTSINISDLYELKDINISNCRSVTNITLNNLPSLKSFNCGHDQWSGILNTLNLNNVPNLEELNCGYNELTTLEIGNLSSLRTLICNSNKLTTLDIPKLINLITLNCYNNIISNLDIDNLTSLKQLDCGANKLSDLNLTKLNALELLNCGNNQLTHLDLSNSPQMTFLTCENNQLTRLDVSNLPLLDLLDVAGNPIEVLIIKNGVHNEIYDNFVIGDLKYLCADASEIEELLQMANSGEWGAFSYISISSFCNSATDGAYYVLNGQTKLDLENDGCDENDKTYPHLKIKISNAVDTGFAITGTDGNFSIHLEAGTYTFQPILDHPDYFSVSPTNATYTIPNPSSPAFCITPKGNFNDLAVSIIPVRAARPGFSDAQYKIVYKNQGTTTQSGSVTFHFDDNKMNSISSSPVADQSDFGLLTFNFTNLAPFESRSALITMRTNAPTDNPAVNVNDVLNFSVNITAQTDETPDDNTAILYQTVIGSYDPNDKTCLEGDIITPDMVGKRVNYLIRFENTGTAPAENVVVTDYIDTTVFDVNSLLVTSASHICHTQISNENKVQFIFSDIQLPFTEPDKHGYVAFSIQLKDHLQIGDSIKNYADIYFDYNLPVTTNEAVSEIKNKVITSVKQKISNIQLSVYPNPSKGNFYVELKSNTNRPIQVNVIDIEGKIVFTKQYKDRQILSIQLDRLAKGTYLVQAQRGNDIVSKKIVIQ
ncbi:MAG: T9SS type A sorting domain-containing protein [Chitinophagales bacterium]|nr:T9SS type A sorting domain-containing protein [Chitinophagales bacterium]